MQGIIIGTVIQGINVTDGMKYGGGPLDWATGFNMMTGIAVVFGYAMLGSTWLIMHCQKDLFVWSRKATLYASFFVGLSMVLVSIVMPISNQHVRELWFQIPTIFFLMFIPLSALVSFLILWYGLYKGFKYIPFFATIIIFFLSFSGICLTMYPWLIPYSVSIYDAAATGTSQSILLIGAVIMLPIILSYTGYCYYLMWNRDEQEVH